MKQKLYSELRSIYETTVSDPHTFRVTIRLKDLIDGDLFTRAVEQTMIRYPYFCVRLCKEGDQLFFEDNPAPVPVFHSDSRIILGGEETNGHFIAFSYAANRIHVDGWHAMTDGGGLSPLFNTLLYVYCSKYYGVDIPSPDLRLPGNEISSKEWADPLKVPLSEDYEGLTGKWSGHALQIGKGPQFFPEHPGIVTALRIPEKEFMHFNLSNDGSPGTIIALLCARAIDSLHPHEEDPVVISLCVNQRKALSAPLAHQSLVGDVRLLYSGKIKAMPFSTQATCFRGMVALQSDRGNVLDEIRDYQALMRELDAMPDRASRQRRCQALMEEATACMTATVSYVGKSRMGQIEPYIQEINCVPSTALPSSHTPVVIEISSVNGFFYVNFIQYLSDLQYTHAFIRQFRDNGIEYVVLSQEEAMYPAIDIPLISR